MSTLPDQITDLLKRNPGLSDREITNALRGATAPQQPVNIAARNLEQKGILQRQKKEDGRIGNYLTTTTIPAEKRQTPPTTTHQSARLQEDGIKKALERWLKANGWRITIAWGKSRGIDIVAIRDHMRWVIEVKSIGSRPEMRVNFFIGILGEILQRMDDPNAKYSIALPHVSQFRGLWERLPHVAKERTKITALFVDDEGSVTEDPTDDKS
jgi:hypothetical protein